MTSEVRPERQGRQGRQGRHPALRLLEHLIQLLLQDRPELLRRGLELSFDLLDLLRRRRLRITGERPLESIEPLCRWRGAGSDGVASRQAGDRDLRLARLNLQRSSSIVVTPAATNCTSTDSTTTNSSLASLSVMSLQGSLTGRI
jgi:hypothetical protein